MQEQGTKETATLGKKLFFSDQDVDRDNPIQLNRLYVQVRNTPLPYNTYTLHPNLSFSPTNTPLFLPSSLVMPSLMGLTRARVRKPYS